jgi:hypothetical protein
MENTNKTPQELEEIRNREMQEFADAAKRAEARAANESTSSDTNALDPSAEVSPSQQERHGQEHGNRRYSMFKNESSSDDMPRTTDTTT